MSQKKRFLWAFASVAMGLAILGLPSSFPRAGPPDDWPPFRMVYREWGPFGVNGAMDYAFAKIDYFNLRHWRFEIIENPGNPAAVGTWSEYIGGRMVSYDAAFDFKSEGPLDPAGIYIPTNWWGPDRMAYRRSQPGVVVRDGGPPGPNIKISGLQEIPGSEVLTWTQVGPCVNMADPGEPPYYPNCVDGKITWVEEYTYLEGLDIPILINYYTNGELTHWVEVLELTFF